MELIWLMAAVALGVAVGAVIGMVITVQLMKPIVASLRSSQKDLSSVMIAMALALGSSRSSESAKEKPVKYGCFVDTDVGPEIGPDACVIPRGDFDDCLYAKEGMKPEDCRYWRPIESDDRSD